MNAPRKHHYIPAFYLARWADGTGQLCEHKAVYDRIAPRRTFPDGTGYEKDLYRIHGVSDEVAHHFESRFMRLVDGDAAVALDLILSNRLSSISVRLRIAWTRFIMSLMFRNPEAVTEIKTHILHMWDIGIRDLEHNYAARRLPSDPPTFSEYLALTDPNAPHIGASNFLQTVIDNDRVGPTILNMQWYRISLASTRFPLLTSDRPLDRPMGLSDPNAYIALPVSPTVLFIAARSAAVFEAVNRLSHSDVAKRVNKTTVAQARKFVWGVNDSQIEFVRRHIGTAPEKKIITDRAKQEAIAAVEGKLQAAE